MRYYYSIFNESTKIESHPQFYFFVLFFFANNICCYRRGVYKRTLFGCYYPVTGNSVKGMRMLNIGLVMYTQEKLSFPVVVYSLCRLSSIVGKYLKDSSEYDSHWLDGLIETTEKDFLYLIWANRNRYLQ